MNYSNSCNVRGSDFVPVHGAPAIVSGARQVTSRNRQAIAPSVFPLP
jgi:hypothetical protein